MSANDPKRTSTTLYGRLSQPASFKFRPILRIFGRRADKEHKVTVHPVTPALYFNGQGLRAHRKWIGVRHLEHRGHSAHHRRKRAALKVFLVGQARLAKMHLGIDHARQQMQSLAINDLAGGSLSQVADRRETAGADADIAQAIAVLVDDGAALENQIVAVGHIGAASKQA
jgi:hypothetical protein